MTRFARAKGSKSSNKRVPEEATSWSDMKQTNMTITKDAAPTKLSYKLEKNEKASIKWSEFPNITPSTTNNSSTQKQVKNTKVNETSKTSNKKTIFKNDKHNKIKSKITKHVTTNAKNNLKEHKRRKPFNESHKVIINGNEIELAYYEGFPIKKVDADRLKQLRKEMISKSIPRSEIQKALKLERRKAEKALAREKKKVCFNCRFSGHTLSECPNLNSNSNQFETGICFKCGSTEHTHFECKVQRGDNFKFAQCFICKEQGHIARQCPDNSRGLYPKGGACRICGDVTHLKKDCPKYQSEQEEQNVVVDTINDQNIESLENEKPTFIKKPKNINKIIKF